MGKGRPLFRIHSLPIEFIALLEHAKSTKLPLIVCADINAHHSLWGGDTDERGLMAEDVIYRYGLKVNNIGSTPTFIGRGAETIVDVTLSMNFDLISGWQVDSSGYGSDHLPISFMIPINTKAATKVMPNLKLINWDNFIKVISEGWENLNLPQHDFDQKWLDKSVEIFENTINKAINVSCPKIKTTSKVQPLWGFGTRSLTSCANA